MKIQTRTFIAGKVQIFYVIADGKEEGRINIAFESDEPGKGYYNTHRYLKGERGEHIVDVMLHGDEELMQKVVDKVTELHPELALNDALLKYCRNAVHFGTTVKTLILN